MNDTLSHTFPHFPTPSCTFCTFDMSKYNSQEYVWAPRLICIKQTRYKDIPKHELHILDSRIGQDWDTHKNKESIDYAVWLDQQEGIWNFVGQTLKCWCRKTRPKKCRGQILVAKTKQFIDKYFLKIRQQLVHAHTHANTSSLLENVDNNSVKMHVIPFRKIKIPQERWCSSRTFKLKKRIHKMHKIQKTTQLDLKAKTAKWNDETRAWDLVGGLKLINNRVTEKAIVYSRNWKNTLGFLCVPKNTFLTKDGRVNVTEMIKQSFAKTPKIKPQTLQTLQTLPQSDFSRFILFQKKSPCLTHGSITNLHSGKSDNKPYHPFICKVKSRLFNKKTQRYMLQLFDGAGLFKINIGDQLFNMVKEKFIDKEDVIQVTQYACTKMSARKRIVVLYEINKIIVKCD